MEIDADSARQFDAVDDVRKKLAELRAADDAHFYERILSDLPQFVACGAQSAGKSSVIRAISGVPLPEAATLCTRMETMIQMRRKNKPLLRVSLLGPDGKEMRSKDLPAGDQKSVRDVVANYQDEVTQKKNFVDDHMIVIQVHGPKYHNATLVDLPGFHTSDDAESERVNQMVQRKIIMPGTLVLHVVKGDQDYGSLLGNDFMRKHTKIARVTVLTHCDKLLDTGNHQEMIKHTLDETSRASSGTFAVLGHLSGNCAEAEFEKVQELQQLDPRLEIGRAALARHVDLRISDHLRLQYPKALASLEDELRGTEAQLEAVRERAPTDSLHEMARKIEQNFHAGRQQLLNDARRVIEKLDFGIRSFTLEGGSGGLKEVDSVDELVPGEFVIYKPRQEGQKYQIVATASDQFTLRALLDGAVIKNVPKTDLRSACSHQTKDVCNDIVKLVEDRGLRNLSHVDIHPIIVHYAAKFANHYMQELVGAQAQMRSLLNRFIQDVFVRDMPISTEDVAADLLCVMEQAAKDVDARAQGAWEALQEANSHPDLIFTPNNHYLMAVTAKLYKEKETSFANEYGQVLKIYCEVRAFIKVQRKAVAEIATKELVRVMVLGTEQRFNALFASSLQRYESWVKEPAQLTRQRAILQRRKAVLQDALGVLQAAMNTTEADKYYMNGACKTNAKVPAVSRR